MAALDHGGGHGSRVSSEGIALGPSVSGQSSLHSQDGIDCIKCPVQRGSCVGQLPSEPGPLRDTGLRAAGGLTQEGTSRGLQVVQGHLQGTHIGEDSGHEQRECW